MELVGLILTIIAGLLAVIAFFLHIIIQNLKTALDKLEKNDEEIFSRLNRLENVQTGHLKACEFTHGRIP